MDFYAAHGDTVTPLPFHTKGSYPYPKGVAYPLDPAHMKYMLEYNTRGVAGPPGASYQFEYKHRDDAATTEDEPKADQAPKPEEPLTN
jgi:hypothetical protein